MLTDIIAGVAIILYALGLLPCLLMSGSFAEVICAVLWPFFAIFDMWFEWRQSHRENRRR